MRQVLASVVFNAEVMPDVNLMWIEAPGVASTAQPGQFITVRCGDLLLRRPFSIHQVAMLNDAMASRVYRYGAADDFGEGEIALLFQVRGRGTYWLSQVRPGDKLDVLGPLGRGFSIEPQARNLLLLAGGVGVAPLVFLTQVALSGHAITLVQGASTASKLYPASLLPFGSDPPWLRRGGEKWGDPVPLPGEVQFVPVTQDGSVGEKGTVADVLPDFVNWADQVCACGPMDMYKQLATSGQLKGVACQISLELRLGCGVGACYACSINTRSGQKKVCRDGPVFQLDDVLWEEVRI